MSVQVKGSGTIGGLDEGLVISGIVTSSTQINVGSNIQLGNAGVITATSFVGSGANLTGITTTTINNNGSNRIITGSSTANTLEGESTFTYNGTHIAKIDTNQTYAMLQLDGNAGGAIEFYENGTRRFEIYGIDAEVALYDRDKGAYHTRFKSGGNVEISDGNLVVASGHGIDFSATADGFGTSSEYEILDDYEEGDFTPYLGGQTNYSSYNITGTGHYVKIGKVVHINVNFSNKDMNNSAAGRVMIYNLPFAPFISSNARGVSTNYMTHNVNHANDGMIHSWYIETTYGSFMGLITKNNSPWTSWDASNFTASGMYLDFQGTYFTAA